MARTDQPEQDRRDFHPSIDEFQNLSTDAFAAILAEARKYRLCLALSHQYIDQLSLLFRQAVFGNVGSVIAFRVGHTDAEALDHEFGRDFSAKQFVELDRYQVLVKLLEDDAHREPFRAATIAPLGNSSGRRQPFTGHSRARFATSRVVVEGRLNSWLLRRT